MLGEQRLICMDLIFVLTFNIVMIILLVDVPFMKYKIQIIRLYFTKICQ